MEKVKESNDHIIGKNYEAENGEIVKCSKITETGQCGKCYYDNKECRSIGCNWSARIDNKAVYFIKQ